MKIDYQDFQVSSKMYLDNLLNKLGSLDIHQIEKLFIYCEEARMNGNTIFWAGNGGSASTASHFASDFMGVNVKRGIRPAYKTISLCDNAAVTTAFGNDFSFHDIFVNQLMSLFCEGDVLVVISASGNSANLVKAVEWVNAHRGKSFGLLGFDGGKLLTLCQDVFFCPSEKGDYGPIEDIHLVIDHIINSYLLSKVS